MKLQAIMTKEIEIVHPNDTIQVAAQKMKQHNIGFLPVMEGDELIGVITDRDLVIRAVTENIKPTDTIGRDLITSPGIYCFDDQETASAMQLMQMHQIRRLVVLDRNDGSVAGVVSLGDLATTMPTNETGEVLQEISSELVKTAG